MALKLGINENICLTGAVVNDKGSLELTFSTGGGIDKQADIFDELMSESGEQIQTGSDSSKLIIFAPLPPKDKEANGDVVTFEVQQKKANDSLSEIRNTLIQFLGCYMTSDKIRFRAFPTVMGLTPEAAKEQITQEATLKAIALIWFQDFVTMVTPLLDEKPALRMILARQAPAKPFLALRRYYVKDNPVVELMTVPLESSALKFTKNEITKGLDKELVMTPTADAAEEAPEAYTFE